MDIGESEVSAGAKWALIWASWARCSGLTRAQCTRRNNQLKQQQSKNKQMKIQVQGLSCPTSRAQYDLTFPEDAKAGFLCL